MMTVMTRQRRRMPAHLESMEPFSQSLQEWLMGNENNLFRRMQGVGNDDNTLALDLQETPEAYEICLLAPGIDKQTIDINATPRSLSVKVERREPPLVRQSHQNPEAEPAEQQQEATTAIPRADNRQQNDRALHRQEIPYGTFSRVLQFGEAIVPDEVKADYQDGLLRISVPKQAQQSIRKVPVTIN